MHLVCLFGWLLERPVARDIDLAVLFRQYSFEAYLETLEADAKISSIRQMP